MRLKLTALALMLCTWLVSIDAQQQVSFLATVTDPATGVPVDTLEASDVRFTEDGMTGRVLKVEPVTRVVKVQILVDNGIGVGRENIGLLRSGVRGLIEALPPDVGTTIVTTAPQPRFLVRSTANREELLRGVDRLAPDTGAGRFVESIGEAAERAQKDKDSFTVIIAAGTTSGDIHLTDGDVKRAFRFVQSQPMIVHVVIYTGGGQSASGGTAQKEVGMALSKMTRGRYENINAMSRSVTLLAELGADVAKQFPGQLRQFRIVVQRPDGKSGEFGMLGLAIAGKALPSVTVEQPR